MQNFFLTISEPIFPMERIKWLMIKPAIQQHLVGLLLCKGPKHSHANNTFVNAVNIQHRIYMVAAKSSDFTTAEIEANNS